MEVPTSSPPTLASDLSLPESSHASSDGSAIVPPDAERPRPVQVMDPREETDTSVEAVLADEPPPASPSRPADDTGSLEEALTAGEVFAARAARAEATAERLIAELAVQLEPGMDEAVQKETAELISLISDLAYEEFTEFFPLVQVAVAAVTSDPPNLTLAARIRRDVRRRTNLLLRPLLFLRTGHPAVQVILGLSTNLYLAIPVALLLLPAAVRGSLFPGSSDHHFVLVGVAGAVGSIVSILVRIEDFDNRQAEHRAILFFTGFFKPMIGIASALFMVIVLEAGLIPIGIEQADQRVFFFLALAFVAGFSERLASDIVTRAEGTVLRGAGAGPQAKG